MRRILAMVCLLGLLASACGGDEIGTTDSATDDEGQAGGDVASTETPDEEPATQDTADDGDSTEPAEGDGGAVADDWDEVVAAAADEPPVVIYQGRLPETMDPLIAAFNEEYPDIEVEYVRMVGGEAIQRVETELSSGNVQVGVMWQAVGDWLLQAWEDGHLLEINGPNTEHWDPADYENGMLNGVIDALAIAYNTDLVPEAPSNWCDPPDVPIGLSEVNIAYHAMVAIQVRDVCTPEEFETLSQQDNVFATSIVTLAESLAAGEIAMASTLPAFVQPFIDQGAPIALAAPEAGSPFVSSFMSAFADSPSPNAARVFIDFAMTERAQEIIAIEGGMPSVSPLGISGVSVEFNELIPVTLDIDEAQVLIEEGRDVLADLRG